MRLYRCLLIVGLVTAGCFSLTGQSNEMLDSFLTADNADVQTTLLLLGQSLNELADNTESSAVMDWAEKKDWYEYVRKLRPDDPIPLGSFSVVLFESYGIRGKSLMYRLFKSPRYAAMEAYNQAYITQNLYHTRSVTPTEVLSALAMAMAMEASHE